MSGFQPEDVGSIPSTRSNKFFGSSEAEHLTVNQRVGISKFPRGAIRHLAQLVRALH